MFGKNEDNYEKSISSEDINFLKEFPNVMICYEKNLHAKFYAGDCFSIITSMNLHEYSQNNNIEVAIVMNPRSSASKIANAVVSSEDLEETSRAYFQEIIDNSDILFQKEPNYESGFLGLSKKYKDSEIVVDKLSEFFTNFTTTIRKQKQNGNTIPENKYNKLSIPKDGFCIRTGVPIPFDSLRPFSYEAYQSWVQFENPDYPETFCHLTGKRSYGKTSMRNPIL